MCKYVIYISFLYHHLFSTKDSQEEDKSCTCRISLVLSITNLHSPHRSNFKSSCFRNAKRQASLASFERNKIFICLMKGKFRSKMSSLLDVSLYRSISRQFSLLVILHRHHVIDVFHCLYAKVIYLYFCNICLCISLY